MAQYLRAKTEHPDAILLFRMGDFYETFFEDARTLARETGIALTSRNAGDADPIPLAGFPWHNAEPYISRLLQAGHRVAVCEQVEEPGKGKKLLERRVVEVLSPGTALSDALLQAGRNNFIVALRHQDDRFGLAAADISTGEFLVADLSRAELADELGRLAPAEVLLPREDQETLLELLEGLDPAPFRTALDAWRFGRDRARQTLLDHYRLASLDAFEAEDLGPGLGAAGALVDYAREQKQSALGHLLAPKRLRSGDGLVLDEATLRSLEVLEPLPGGSAQNTLLSVCDQTLTAAGARRLRRELRRPLAALAPLLRRAEAVAALADSVLRAELRELLRGTSDLERILGKLHCARALPRDLAGLRQTLRAAPQIEELARRYPPLARDPELAQLTGPSGVPPSLPATLEAALVEQPPATLADGGVIRDGHDPKLDELRLLARDGKSWIARLQEEERSRTGIPTLKVGFNRVFGYYIEVSQSQLAKVPDRYQRKQTLAGAERFLTPELKEHEEKVLRAEEEQLRRERALFESLCAAAREQTIALQQLAERLAGLDLLQSLAETAARRRWIRPTLDLEPRLSIQGGRHPVVESAIGSANFIANDTELDDGESQLVLLTGPNMAGKSTYLRQVGLIVILAQLGCPVPAEEARIGLVDRIFTRVGAQDSLARGQSTFLVEMIETSRILHHATRRSLVLLDEVGRGTSTYDGLAIAWAVAEALESETGPRPRTIFATHFHELTRLARPGRGFRNYNVEVKEWGDQVIFLRRVVEGAADRSYGIHVARLAGVPEPVVRRARHILEALEEQSRRMAGPAGRVADEASPFAQAAGGAGATGAGTAAGATQPKAPVQLALFDPVEPPFVAELRSCDLDRLSPLDALQMLHRWKAGLR